MSARGAANHAELFVQQSTRSESKISEFEELKDDYSPEIQDKLLHDTYGAGDASEDPLQLEHMIGFGGEFPCSVISLPLNDCLFAKWYINEWVGFPVTKIIWHSMGNLISIENMNDPHDQKILRGHDMKVI